MVMKCTISQYGGISLGDQKDTNDFKFFTYEQLPIFIEKHQSLLSQVLTDSLFRKLKNTQTSTGFTFSNVIQSGVEGHDLNIGAVAGDVDSYSVFKDLFDEIIKKYHDFDPAIRKHVHFYDGDKLNLKDLNKLNLSNHIISTKITAVRNIAEYPLPAGTNYDLRQETEEVLKKVFQKFKRNFSGKYYSIDSLSERELDAMLQRGYMFEEPTSTGLLFNSGSARNWPKNRGIFCNDDRTVLCWCNHQDHCSLISLQQGHNIKKVYEDFSALSDLFMDNLTSVGKNIMQNDTLGYLSTCPSNLGSGLKVSVTMTIHKLLKDRTKLNKICRDNLLEPKIINLLEDGQEVTKLDISSTRSLGVTDIELLQNFVNGIAAIIRTEEKM
jgi:protein-arginine kinase